MRIISALAMVAVLGGLGTAFANDHVRNDERAAPAISTKAMKAQIGAMGYDVVRLKQDDGMYKARIVEHESGAGVKAAFDKQSGELIGAKLARDNHEAGEREHEAGERKESREQESRAERGSHRESHERSDRD
jgi:hypothetical protein